MPRFRVRVPISERESALLGPGGCRQFWMGHKGDIEARYTTNKSRLPQDVMDDMRLVAGFKPEE